jgi:hypothetical protein
MIKIGILAVVFVALVIVRFVIRKVNKLNQGGAINKIKKRPALAAGYADGLDFPYNRKECDAATFELIRTKIKTCSSIGKYKVLYATDADANRMLVFTELAFNDLLFSYKGESANVEEKAFHDFALVFSPGKNELQVYSSAFGNTDNKFQKQEFLQAVMQMESR